jgi:hypothetical protein
MLQSPHTGRRMKSRPNMNLAANRSSHETGYSINVMVRRSSNCGACLFL